MPIKDILKELKITQIGNFARDGSYVIDLEDDVDAFGKVYSTLDKNPDVEYMENNSLLTVDNASMYYKYDKYQVNIIADFKNNHYKVVIAEV